MVEHELIKMLQVLVLFPLISGSCIFHIYRIIAGVKKLINRNIQSTYCTCKVLYFTNILVAQFFGLNFKIYTFVANI